MWEAEVDNGDVLLISGPGEFDITVRDFDYSQVWDERSEEGGSVISSLKYLLNPDEAPTTSNMLRVTIFDVAGVKSATFRCGLTLWYVPVEVAIGLWLVIQGRAGSYTEQLAT